MKDFGFDFVLPISVPSTSPLKVRKSGRAQKAPEPGSGPQQSTRRSPTLAKASTIQNIPEHRDGISSPVVEIEGEEDVLVSNPPGSGGNPASVNKRKYDGSHNLEQPATKKRRKATPKHGFRKPRSTTTITTEKILRNLDVAHRDTDTINEATKDDGTEEATTKRKRKAMPLRGPQKMKSSTTASTHKILEPVEDTSLNKGAMDEGRQADFCLAELSGPLQNEPGAGAAESDKEVARLWRAKGGIGRSDIKPKKKPSQRKPQYNAKVHQEDMDHESLTEQAPTAQQVVAVAAPTRKRKKRKSIGQQTTKRAKKVVPNARQRTKDSRANHETSDLVNELLDDTIELAPQITGKLQTLERIDRDLTGQTEDEMQHAAPSAPTETSCPDPKTVNDPNTTFDPPNKKTEQPLKPKPRKKHRSITQARRSNPKPGMKNDVQEGPPEEIDIAPQLNAASSATLVTSRKNRGRKPLSNITNLTPDLAKAETVTAPAKEITQPPAPPKKRGRPPKNPVTDNGDTSASGNDIKKPPPMSESLETSSTGPAAASTKTAKPPAKPRKSQKTLQDPIRRVVKLPVRSHVDDLDSDSDDPLSGASFVRLKKTFKPVKVAARGSPDRRERHISCPETSAEIPESKAKITKMMKGESILHKPAKPTQRAKQIATPQGKSVEDEKRREAEQKEIEGLLSSIGKAVKRGRAMAASEA